jgi:dihydroorotate dehydrogenase electron transfer subunit
MPSPKTVNIKAGLLSNKRIRDKYWHAVLQAPDIAARASAGQFLSVLLSETKYEPLLRRPFSIHKVSRLRVEILYEVVGKGTQVFSRKKPGEQLDIIGPLGKGFDLTASERKGIEVSILVAGGIGIAPLLFLAKRLESMKSKPETIVLIGARTKNQVLCLDEFKRSGCSVRVSTDDGTQGERGRVTNLLENVLRKVHDPKRTTIYACGPKPMLKGTQTIANKYNIPAQLSLESHMACGIGACLGCVVDTIDGFKRVCKEGPVFQSNQIIWGKE